MKSPDRRCALCLELRPLRFSHIYPEWVYKPLYDEKHRLEVLSVVPDGRNELRQKGMRERLLCEACEQKFSSWEGYVHDLFVKPAKPLEVERQGSLLRIGGLDYPKLKLFELSILWRAGVSTLPFFAKCRLGPHAEIIRFQLAHSDPGDADRYGALMYGLKVGELPETLQVIAEPRPVRSHGIRAYNLTFAGFLWLFHVASANPPSLLRQCYLREDGTRFINVRNALEMQNLQQFATELGRLGRVPRRQ